MGLGESARQAHEAGDSWDEIAAAVVRELVERDRSAATDAVRLAENLSQYGLARQLVLQEVGRRSLSPGNPLVAAVLEFVRASDRCLGLEEC